MAANVREHCPIMGVENAIFHVNDRTSLVLKTRFHRVIVPLSVLIWSGGCATVPPLNFTPVEVPHVSKQFDVDLRNVIVTVAHVGETKGPIDFNLEYSQIMPGLWQTSLVDALSRLSAFNDSSPTKVDLRVEILEFAVPPRGASMTTKTIARYEIVDRRDGKTLFAIEISSRFKVPFSYSIDGTVRATRSINKAVQANITKFLDHLIAAKFQP